MVSLCGVARFISDAGSFSCRLHLAIPFPLFAFQFTLCIALTGGCFLLKVLMAKF